MPMPLLYLLYIYLVFLVFFSLGKLAFLVWVGDNYSLGDMWDVVCHGFTMDLSMTSCFILVTCSNKLYKDNNLFIIIHNHTQFL